PARRCSLSLHDALPIWLRDAVAGGAVAVAEGDLQSAVNGLFAALVPAVPYAPATAFLGAEKAKLRDRRGERRRVAVIADGIGSIDRKSTRLNSSHRTTS